MTPAAVLEALRAAGANLAIRDGRVGIKTLGRRLPDDLLALAREHREALRELLTTPEGEAGRDATGVGALAANGVGSPSLTVPDDREHATCDTRRAAESPAEPANPGAAGVSAQHQVSHARRRRPDPTGLECPACGCAERWRSRHGLTICRRCHPPAPGAEVADA